MNKLYKHQACKKERLTGNNTSQDIWAASFTDIELAQWIEEVGTTTGKKDIQDNAIQPAGCMANVMGFSTAICFGAAQAGDCKEAKSRQTKTRPLY